LCIAERALRCDCRLPICRSADCLKQRAGDAALRVSEKSAVGSARVTRKTASPRSGSPAPSREVFHSRRRLGRRRGGHACSRAVPRVFPRFAGIASAARGLQRLRAFTLDRTAIASAEQGSDCPLSDDGDGSVRADEVGADKFVRDACGDWSLRVWDGG
jgi:hypothetical protein